MTIPRNISYLATIVSSNITGLAVRFSSGTLQATVTTGTTPRALFWTALAAVAA